MNEMQQEMYNSLCKLSGEEVARLFLDWLGLQVMDAGFREFLGNEGVMDEYIEEDTDEEEDEKDDEKDDEEEFFEFCNQFSGCIGCPFESVPLDLDEECKEHYFQMKKEQHED